MAKFDTMEEIEAALKLRLESVPDSISWLCIDYKAALEALKAAREELDSQKIVISTIGKLILKLGERTKERNQAREELANERDGGEWRVKAGHFEMKRDQAQAGAAELRRALEWIQDWFQSLEDGTTLDDPLRAIRLKAHAPVHICIEKALASTAGSELLAELECEKEGAAFFQQKAVDTDVLLRHERDELAVAQQTIEDWETS